MADETVHMQGACSGMDRTWQLTVDNQTDQTVDIWFAQVRDTTGQILPGYVADTGVFVASTNINPHSQDAIDPCLVGGGNNACQGNEITGTLKVVDASGTDTDVTLERASCAPGQYFPRVNWKLAYQVALTGESLISAEVDRSGSYTTIVAKRSGKQSEDSDS
jgi:hypothetical protein